MRMRARKKVDPDIDDHEDADDHADDVIMTMEILRCADDLRMLRLLRYAATVTNQGFDQSSI
eukprot:9388859-Lingulodinium_polyedra.AAC.1